MPRFSIFGLAKNALSGHKDWAPTWRDASPRESYDIVIIGGGGHGLATAYYLAKVHGVAKVAVIEKGWIGGGNAGRNTTIIRSNYGLPGNEPFYEWSMKLWEGLEQELNYNAMVSQRGVLNLYHSDAQRDAFARRGNAMRLHGVDSDLLDQDGVRKLAPFLNFDQARFPVMGGLYQARGGTARHDAVAWGYARGASDRGVDIVQNCEVTGFLRDASGAVIGIETSRGAIRAGKVAMSVAGNSSRVAALADLRLPIESHVLQAFVSEAPEAGDSGGHHLRRRPFLHQPVGQGGLVFGGDIDGYNSYASRGNLPVVEDVCEGGMAIMPMIGRVRLLLRLGRDHGHVHGWLADHRPRADRRPLYQRRLVLRRLQGDPRRGAGVSRTCWPPIRRTRRRPPTGWTGSARAT